MIWKKKNQEEIKTYVFEALQKNKNYRDENVLGVPASYLDPQVFSHDDRILKDAPFLTTLVNNPNHIGCHTLDDSESFFAGTQTIEKEVIAICAEDIMKASSNSCDGYIASGGTEANIQAIWIYRNYYIKEFDAKQSEIAIICSRDSHYSMPKAANLLSISCYSVEVDEETRVSNESMINQVVEQAIKEGKKYFIVVANMMTTMFGSVDQPNLYSKVLTARKCTFRIHIDAAFGGFYYPFSNPDNELNFENELVSSITMDAHKMAQAPYGTGVFLIRKNLMKYTNTKEASYVEGEDYTLIGSRSGANAISIWMILSRYGPNGWMEKIFILQKRTDWLCNKLMEAEIKFYRHPGSNIVTMKANHVRSEVAQKYGLVPDNHTNIKWYKIVIMDHVTIERLEDFLSDL